MITANELRIGNYVWNERQNLPVKVDIIIIQNQIYADKGLRESWKPIPLTEEILLKCESIMFDGLLYEYRSDNFVFKSDFKYVWIYDIELKACICVKCEYLHLFQNLIHSITGQELEINF